MDVFVSVFNLIMVHFVRMSKWQGEVANTLTNFHGQPQTLTGFEPSVFTSAVKRLKYLIAINRIYVIVNSK